MKISEGHTKPIEAPTTSGVSTDSSVKKGKPFQGAPPPPPADGADGGVKVTVSDKARKLAESQTVDTAKVDRLKAKIEGGTFEIDAAKIAGKIVGGSDE